MTIPASSTYSSTYPTSIDTNQNLFHVNDALRVRLASDYNPGDTVIYIMGDEATMRSFNSTGIITLTDQCNDPEQRGISFYYGLRTLTTFEQLELLPGHIDVAKPANLTNITQNVMAEHHNGLKNAIINIENFAGEKGKIATQPLVGTMEERTNFLINLALQPKAWFTTDKTIGLAPLTIQFIDQSFRLGTNGFSASATHIWDFGDNTGPSIITIDEDGVVPSNVTNVLVNALGSGSIQKTYTKPGIYDVTLTVTNDYGSDSITLSKLINARFPAPDEAVIEFVQRSGQIVTAGIPVNGPYTTTPVIRAGINTLIDATINAGINPNTGKTFSGETVDISNTPIDPIETYTWIIPDDLEHSNSTTSTSVFSVGGLYDLVLRVDTKYGSYRITNYFNAFDIVESVNLWLWNYNLDQTVSSYEFGLISETFKAKGSNSLNLQKNSTFLNGAPNETQQKREFNRNNGFSPLGTSSSGSGGSGLLYWASGRNSFDSPTLEAVNFSEFNGFTGSYLAKPSINRPWNWVGLGSVDDLYFILGGVTSAIAPFTSPTNQTKDSLSLSTYVNTSSLLTNGNYLNGASELTENEVSYDGMGNSLQGNMSVYRSTWHKDTGYFIRNQGVGNFFRLQSFYGTSGNMTELFQNIRKLADVAGSAKVEGQLVSLSNGVYLFTNSGSIAAFNTTSNVWQVGGPGAYSASFRSLQDNSVTGFDNANQTFLAASDNDKLAYLSFDYSAKSFIKFNEADTTFSSVTPRPSGSQWQMCIY